MAKNILRLFLDKLFDFPLWIKQIIYLKLHKNLQASLSEEFIQTNANHIFQLYVPILSFLGRTELEERTKGYDTNIYNFLLAIDEGLNILEIAMNNFWTMEEIAKHFVFCLDQDYIKKPESKQVYAIAGFMSGKFRTGEYFKNTGRIDVYQLENTIIKQKELSQQGSPKKMAELMIELGYLTQKECTSLLIIKEEAKKRFILDGTIIPDNISEKFVTEDEYKEQIARLTEQNKKLKDKLTKLLTFFKKNA